MRGILHIIQNTYDKLIGFIDDLVVVHKVESHEISKLKIYNAQNEEVLYDTSGEKVEEKLESICEDMICIKSSATQSSSDNYVVYKLIKE